MGCSVNEAIARQEAYIAARKRAVDRMVLNGLGLCALVVLCLGDFWWAIQLESRVLVYLFFAAGLFLTLWGGRRCVANIREAHGQLEAARAEYWLNVGELPKLPWKKALVIVLLLAVVGAGIWAAVRYHQVMDIYTRAEALIAQEQYEEAETLLRSIEATNPWDTGSLLRLCEARRAYAQGNSEAAYDTLKDADFFYQDQAALEKIRSFTEPLEKESMRKQLARDAERKKREEEEARKSSLNDWVNYRPPVVVRTPGPVISHDPDVENFSNPEDFYDYYYYDFFDYYDAENYYYDHGGR